MKMFSEERNGKKINVVVDYYFYTLKACYKCILMICDASLSSYREQLTFYIYILYTCENNLKMLALPL